MDGKAAAEDQLKKLLKDPALLAALGEKLAKSPPEGDSE
jgi:type VI secretion system protein ImpB